MKPEYYLLCLRLLKAKTWKGKKNNFYLSPVHCGRVITFIIQCHPEEDGFLFDSCSSQCFFMSSHEVFFATVASSLLMRDLNLEVLNTRDSITMALYALKWKIF